MIFELFKYDLYIMRYHPLKFSQPTPEYPNLFNLSDTISFRIEELSEQFKNLVGSLQNKGEKSHS